MPTLGWYPDPSQRHELRFFDGQRWTHHVADRGVRGVDEETGASHVESAGKPAASANADPWPTGAGWYADPVHGHELRYFDGERWTEYVADDDDYRVDRIN